MDAKKRKLKNGRTSWTFTYTHPSTKRKSHRSFKIGEKREAEKSMSVFIDNLEKVALGRPAEIGWSMAYEELVQRFLAEAPISSKTRKGRLKKDLERNLIGLKTGAELSQRGKLTALCLRLKDEHGSAEFVRKCVQQPLKQLSNWAASVDLFGHDPLSCWKKIPRTKGPKEKRAWKPDEFRLFLDAAKELDNFWARRHSTTMIFKTLLITGNRPSAVFNATVGDLEKTRIRLSPGNGKKRNGECTIPPEFHKELAFYLLQRRRPSAAEPLLVSPNGSKLNIRNLHDIYMDAAVLSAVRIFSEGQRADVNPLDIAYAIRKKKVSFAGPPPTTPETIANQQTKRGAIEKIVREIGSTVENFVSDRPLYSLRKTHRMWATNVLGDKSDCVRLQCGWSATDPFGKNYFDGRLVEAGKSSKAVWDVLTRKLQLDGEQSALRKAVGSEIGGEQEQKTEQFPQPKENRDSLHGEDSNANL